jgi:uncharacterized membrane protein
MKFRIELAIVALILALGLQPAWGQSKVASSDSKPPAPRYRITMVPLRPSAINDAGQIAGTSSSFRAATWKKKGGLHEVSLPAGFTRAEGIALNRHGHLVGVAVNLTTNQRQGFEYSNGKLTFLSGSESKPSAINDAGQIAGEAMLNANGKTAAVVWKGHTAIDLGGCCGGTAVGLNNHLQAIANIYDKQGQYQAFLWDQAHGLQAIGPPGGFSSALEINDAGHVVIESFSHGILFYEDGKLTALALSPKHQSQARALSNSDEIVGSFGPFPDSAHAFLWDKKQGFRDLNDLVAPGSGWKLRAATAINAKGEIVGWGDLNGEESVGFLLTPLP